MIYNVTETCKVLVNWVQDAPGPWGVYNPMTGLVSEPVGKKVFWGYTVFNGISQCSAKQKAIFAWLPSL